MSIEYHDFQDVEIGSATVSNGMVDINLVDWTNHIQFDRDDIIAMAKAIELTGEDLK